MKKSFTLEVPMSIDDIPLHRYQKYVKIIEENKESSDQEFLSLKLLSIFCNITMKDAYKMPLAKYDSLLKHLSKLLSSKPKLQTRFTMKDKIGKKVEFGFLPNLDKMTLGEYIDAERYLTDWQKIHKAMAVLYRPIVAGNKDFYKIEKYNGTDKYADVMKDAPASIALGSILFFFEFRDRIVENYSGIFTQSSRDIETGSFNQGFGKKWGWYQSIYSLAKGDVFKIDKATETNLHKAMMWLEFEKDKSDLEERMIKKAHK